MFYLCNTSGITEPGNRIIHEPVNYGLISYKDVGLVHPHVKYTRDCFMCPFFDRVMAKSVQQNIMKSVGYKNDIIHQARSL